MELQHSRNIRIDLLQRGQPFKVSYLIDFFCFWLDWASSAVVISHAVGVFFPDQPK
jgi:hypothetical protein